MVEKLLVGLAGTFPTLGYYQGLSYIAIFTLKFTDFDFDKSFSLLHHIYANFLVWRFDKDFHGLVELGYVCDGLLMKYYPEIWNQYDRHGVSTVHFAVQGLITLFTSNMIQIQTGEKFILMVWDLLLGGGLFELCKFICYILGCQAQHIIKLDEEECLLIHKGFDQNPFVIAQNAGCSEEEIKELWKNLKKSTYRNSIHISRKYYDRLVSHFYQIHLPRLNFWTPNLSKVQ